MEILSPAGSIESVRAAILSGADAIYIGFGDFNARRNAKNFTTEEFIEAANLCHLYNVNLYVTMNILLTDRELKSAVDFIKLIADIGITAVIVQDLGVLSLIKQVCPAMPVHASTQLTVHNLDGALKAKELGFSRVVLSRELSFENIKYISQNCDIELEIFVHGALCMCYSGQCYLSSVIGSRSGNRGLCAQPCRLPYSYCDKNTSYPLSLKDLSLINHIDKLKELGISCLKIEGRMKKPEYTAVVTKIYSSVLKENRMPTDNEIKMLTEIFSRDGFTDGYFDRQSNSNMFGTKSASYKAEEIAKNVNLSYKSYPVDFTFNAFAGENISLTAFDIQKNESVTVYGDIPEIAINKPTTSESVEKSLRKTGGTIFTTDEVLVNIDQNLMVSASSINKLRRECLDELTKKRSVKTTFKTFDVHFEKPSKNVFKRPEINVEITKFSQISCEFKEANIIYIPLTEIVQNEKSTKELLLSGYNIAVKLPKIITDNESSTIVSMLEKCKNIGIKTALISNIGFIDFAKDFILHADYGMNMYNSYALNLLSNFECATISFELKTSQIRDMKKTIKTEILAYGHLPLMIFENCAIKKEHNKCVCTEEQVYLSDRKNEKFALLAEFGCRNTLLNSKPLFILDKMSDFSNIGIDYIRLYFTTEDTQSCAKIFNAYKQNDQNFKPLDHTRGLYYRGTL